jgi:DDE superfamily endonuclease
VSSRRADDTDLDDGHLPHHRFTDSRLPWWHNFNVDGFGSLVPKYARGRPPTFTLPQRCEIRIAIVLDNFSPHLSTKKDGRVGDWAAVKNVEFAYVPLYASWLNRIEAQFQALRYFALDGTDHPSHDAQGRMIRPLHRLAEPQRPRTANYVNS